MFFVCTRRHQIEWTFFRWCVWLLLWDTFWFRHELDNRPIRTTNDHLRLLLLLLCLLTISRYLPISQQVFQFRIVGEKIPYLPLYNIMYIYYVRKFANLFECLMTNQSTIFLIISILRNINWIQGNSLNYVKHIRIGVYFFV